MELSTWVWWTCRAGREQQLRAGFTRISQHGPIIELFHYNNTYMTTWHITPSSWLNTCKYLWDTFVSHLAIDRCPPVRPYKSISATRVLYTAMINMRKSAKSRNMHKYFTTSGILRNDKRPVRCQLAIGNCFQCLVFTVQLRLFGNISCLSQVLRFTVKTHAQSGASALCNF